MSTRTGVDADQLTETMDAISEPPEVGQFRFYAADAAAMGIELDDPRFETAGDVDLRGVLGTSEDVRAGYADVTRTTSVDADASEEELAERRGRVEATSPLTDDTANEVPLETELVVERSR